MKSVADNGYHVGHKKIAHPRIFLKQGKEVFFPHSDDLATLADAIGGQAHFASARVARSSERRYKTGPADGLGGGFG